MSLVRQLANAVLWRVKPRFIWQSDQETFGEPEFWDDSFADDIEAAEKRGDDDWFARRDCDEHAMACGTLCRRAGVDALHIGLATCFVEGPRGVGTGEYHAVCWVRDKEAQEDLVLDNRARGLVTWDRLPYRWVKHNCLTSPRDWYALGRTRQT